MPLHNSLTEGSDVAANIPAGSPPELDFTHQKTPLTNIVQEPTWKGSRFAFHVDDRGRCEIKGIGLKLGVGETEGTYLLRLGKIFLFQSALLCLCLSASRLCFFVF